MSGLFGELVHALEQRAQTGRELRALAVLLEGVAAERIGAFLQGLPAPEEKPRVRWWSLFRRP